MEHNISALDLCPFKVLARQKRRALSYSTQSETHPISAMDTRPSSADRDWTSERDSRAPLGRKSALYNEETRRVPLTCSNLAFQASLAKGPWPTMTRRVQILRKSRPSAQSWYSRNTGLSSTGTRSGMTTSSSKRRPTSSGTAPSHRVSSRAALAEMTAQVYTCVNTDVWVGVHQCECVMPSTAVGRLEKL
jgi:hypothetical protein